MLFLLLFCFLLLLLLFLLRPLLTLFSVAFFVCSLVSLKDLYKLVTACNSFSNFQLKTCRQQPTPLLLLLISTPPEQSSRALHQGTCRTCTYASRTPRAHSTTPHQVTAQAHSCEENGSQAPFGLVFRISGAIPAAVILRALRHVTCLMAVKGVKLHG